MINILTVLALVAAPVFAKPSPVKPGLWEISIKMKSAAGEADPHAEMKKAMAKMSPEQRKQMSAMMAQSGVKMDPAGGVGTKVCYTRELLDQGASFVKDPNRNCETKTKERSSKRMTVDFKCADGSTGTGEWNFPSATAFDGKMRFTDKAGKVSEMTQKGKFLGSDCGDVKPFSPPR